MADFPTTPSNGDTFTQNGRRWIYNSTVNAWDLASGSAIGGNLLWESDGSDGYLLKTGPSPTEAIRIDSSRNVFIGKSSGVLGTVGIECNASGKLRATRSAGTPFQINRKTDDGELIQYYQDDSLIGNVGVSGTSFTFGQGSGEAMRIDSNQRVIIGDTSAINADSSGDDLVVGNLTGAHGITIVTGTTSIGRLLFSDGSGGATDEKGQVLYDHSNNSMGFNINDSRAMTIDSGQKVLIGATTSASVDNASQAGWYWNTGSLAISSSTSTGLASHRQFVNPNGVVGSIQSNGSSTLFNTSSDPRLKTAFSILSDPDLDSAFNNILSNTGEFEFLSNPGVAVVGFNAHGIIDIVGLGSEIGGEGNGPRAGVIGAEYDTGQVDGDGNPVMERITPAGVDQSKVVPYLVLKIKQLESRIVALEAV